MGRKDDRKDGDQESKCTSSSSSSSSSSDSTPPKEQRRRRRGHKGFQAPLMGGGIYEQPGFMQTGGVHNSWPPPPAGITMRSVQGLPYLQGMHSTTTWQPYPPPAQPWPQQPLLTLPPQQQHMSTMLPHPTHQPRPIQHVVQPGFTDAREDGYTMMMPTAGPAGPTLPHISPTQPHIPTQGISSLPPTRPSTFHTHAPASSNEGGSPHSWYQPQPFTFSPGHGHPSTFSPNPHTAGDDGYTVLMPTAGPAGLALLQPTTTHTTSHPPPRPHTFHTHPSISSNDGGSPHSWYQHQPSTFSPGPHASSHATRTSTGPHPVSTNGPPPAPPAPAPPLIPLPVCLLHSPGQWGSGTQQQQWPGAPSPPDTDLLYDTATGLVLDVGPGNTGLLQELVAAGHVLQPVGAACCQRVADLQGLLNGDLMAQRTRILNQQARLNLRAGEVRAAAASLAHQTQSMMGDMLDRLAAAETAKLSQLSTHQAQLASNLSSVEEVISRTVQACQAHHPGPDSFLATSALLMQDCNRLAAKTIPDEVHVSPDDLPFEARSVADLTRANATLSKLIRVKDAMIWQLLRERDEMGEQANQMANSFTAEMEAMDKHCAELQQRLNLGPTDDPAPATAAHQSMPQQSDPS